DIINEQGGVLGRQIKLIMQDGECNPAKAVTATKHLIEIEGVSVLLGGSCSSESIAIAPVANENKVLQVATLTSADSYSDAGPYSFRVFPTSTYYVGKQAQLALQQGVTSIVIIYEQKAYPQSVFAAFKKGFEANGGTVIQEHAFPSEETDFRSYLLKAKESGAQAILFSAQGTSSAVNFLKHYHELDLQDSFKLIGNSVVAAKKVFDESQGLNVGVTAVDAYADRSTLQAQELLTRYAAKYGQEPQTNFGYVAASYDRVFLVARAMEACESVTDTDCMAAYLSAV
ncbi:MAG: ABC transporter substrate-binding protein, partial [Candidatus Woesearchaeota archaeon]|nr:ABC transporter substrate-binding protein [Candidatus Woesearchaeota archaeon]